MIEAKNLRKRYSPKKGVEVNALDDVSLRLPDTGMVFVLGKSGSGKSTLLNVLGGLDTIDSGEIFIKGQSSKEFKQSHFDSYRNTYVGFIFQEYNILEEFTVGANIALAIELQGRKATNEEINSILAEVDLAGLGARKPNELSGGQKQRVAIARALVKNPEIIMADEPTGALDSNTGRQVFDTLKELSKKKLVLIVSHDREFSELYADRIIELADGKIISDVEYDKEATENAEEPNLSYVGKEITIKDGYELTDADRIAINEYIKKVKSNTSLIINDKRQNKIFKNTDEDKIPPRTNKDFKLIKSKLSIKNAFKLGSSGLKYKKVRLVFTIFLSFIAFALFGLADSVASYDSITTCTDSLIDSGIDYASFQKQTKWIYNEDDPDDFYWEGWDKFISKDELAILEQQTGLKYTPVLGGWSLELGYTSEVPSSSTSSDSRYDWTRIYPNKFSGVASLNDQMISSYGYSLTGALPANKNEIVLPSFIAEYYVKMGFLQYNKQTDKSDIVTINSVNDMIGKEITVQIHWNIPTQKYKVVGILNTGFDTSRYEVLADTRNENIMNMVIGEELNAAMNYSLHAVLFIHQDLLNDVNAMLKGNVSNVRNGNFEVMKYKDKNANLDDSNYDGWPNSYYNLHKLSHLDTSKIKWLTDAPVTALEKYDIVLTINDVSMLLNSYEENNGDGKEEDLFLPDTIEAVGEADIAFASMHGYTTINPIIDNLDYYMLWSWAWNNFDDAIAHIKAEHESTFNENNYLMWDDSIGEDVVDKNQICSIFADYESGNKCNLLDEKASYDALMSKYGVTGKVITYEQYKLKTIVFPDNDTYSLFHSISKIDYERNQFDILCAKLALEFFYDAIDVAKAKPAEERPYWYHEYLTKDEHGNDDYVTQYSSSFGNYKQEFSYAMNGSDCTLSDAEKTAAKNAYVDYTFEKLENMEIKLAIRYNTYGNKPANEESKDARVVGITTEAGVKVAVSDEIYNALVDEISMGDYAFVVAPMPKERSEVNAITRFSYENTHYDGMARFALKNSVTEELGMIDETLEVLGQVFLYVGLGFALFASLMLSNFIATSISHKKQEIGILRAIGSRSSDVFMIFFAESFIISMINFVLSVVATGVVVSVINNIFREDIGLLITFLSFGIRQIALLLGVSLLVAVIATFFPVKKIASMKPIDAIKNRK